MRERRIKRLEVPARYLEAVFTERSPLVTVINHGFPDDAEIVGFVVEPERRCVLTVYVHSETFPIVPEGEIIPTFSFSDHAIYWPPEIAGAMRDFLKAEGIPFKDLPEVTEMEA